MAAEILALVWGNVNKYQFKAGKGILPSQFLRILEQSKFEYSPSSQILDKHTKTIKEEGGKTNKSNKMTLQEVTTTPSSNNWSWKGSSIERFIKIHPIY